jgi:hypothetical protein
MSKTEAEFILLSGYRGDVFWEWSKQRYMIGCSAAQIEIEWVIDRPFMMPRRRYRMASIRSFVLNYKIGHNE